MKNFFNRLKNIDRRKAERLLMFLLPAVTLVLVASILVPTLLMLSDAEAEPTADARYIIPDDTAEPLSALPEATSAPTAEPTPEPTAEPAAEFTDYIPVYDELGRQTYSYSFDLGSNGCLLYRGTDIESNVFPNDEDEDGVPDYGLRWVEDESTEGGGDYERVELYNADNSPVSEFAIDAVAVTYAVTVTSGWQTISGRTYYYGSDGSRYTGVHKIDGKLCYFNEFGVKADALGIDVSSYNGNINWAAVKASGIDFAIIRVGGRGWESGSIYDDSYFDINLSEALSVGLQVGVYFYSTADDAAEAAQEALYTVSRLNGAKLALPIYIDTEQSGDYPDGRADTLSKSLRAQIIDSFCEIVTAAGYRAGVYSGQNFLSYMMSYDSASKYEIWLASYTSSNRLPSFRMAYDMWQFTDSGLVSGINGVVDMDAVFSSYDN